MKMTTDYDALEAELGPGPMRFAFERNDRSIEEQMKALNEEEQACVSKLKDKWTKANPDKSLDDADFLRFARCSPGKTKFNAKTAWKVLKDYDYKRFQSMKAANMEQQLLSKTLFPVPGLRTKEGNHAMFYMRPSRYFPSKTSTTEIIDNLAYSMQALVREENACTDGIGFLANMSEWKMANFGVNYCLQFMMMLQGQIPVRVRLFLIVNPPSWFDSIWKIMKPMLMADFRKKVHMIPESELPKFLAEGFEKFLPADDIAGAEADPDELVKDFVTYRKRVEG